MKNFLKGVDLKAQNQRNGFDVSYQNQFTAPFGMLLPHFFQRVNPGDKVKIAPESQTICDGLVKPAFMRLREHMDYYFIPATQLWMPFDEFVTGQNSYFSTSIANNNENAVPYAVPMVSLAYIGGCLENAYYLMNDIKDDLGFSFDDGAIRLFDLLGYFNLTKISTDRPVFPSELFEQKSTLFNLLPLLCYQKVYYDFYRNPKYEDNDVEAYNIDDIATGTEINEVTDLPYARFRKFCKIHYRWQKKDYFTQTQPNILVDSSQIGYDGFPNVGFGNMFNLPGVNIKPPHLELNNNSAVNKGNYVATGGYTKTGSAGTAANIIDQGVSVANIRFAFAYDKLLRRMREAGADFDKQMLAQFGVKPYDARHGKATYIGGFTNKLSSSDVTNMTGENIGDLAGQINSYNDNTSRMLNYSAKEHGYIIGIYSTSVDNMYQSYRSSREVLLKNRFDWFNPAFENLGLQPVFACERDNISQQSVDVNDIDSNSYSTVIGYVPRYSELKTHVDECHGTLCQYSDIVGMKEWNVQTNQDVRASLEPLQKTNMLLNPKQFDAVAGVQYNGIPTTDHFVVNVFNHSRKVSAMSLFETF